MDEKIIIEQIKKARIEKGYSMREFAKMIDKSVSYISFIENNKIGKLLFCDVVKMCQVLNIDIFK